MRHLRDGERYETLYDLLGHQHEPAVRHLVGSSPYADREDLLHDLFDDLVAYHDDETACRCFGWIVKASEDWLLQDHLEDKDAKRQGRVRIFRRPKDCELLERRREQLPSAVALKRWPRLPAKGKGSCRVQDTENESHLEDCDVPTMLKTKKVLLEAIAERWRDTKDDVEADTLFDLILSAADACRFEEERKMVESVVREATGSGFSAIRAVRFYLLLTRELVRKDRFGCGLRHQIAKTLAIAWARNCQLEDQAQVFGAVWPLLKERRDPSFPEFDYMRRTAVKVSLLEEQLTSLRERLNPNSLFGGRQVRFLFLSPTAILVTETCQAGYGRLDENRLHDRFGELRDLVEGWRKDFPTVNVTVRLEVPSTLKDGEFLFEREQLLDRSVG